VPLTLTLSSPSPTSTVMRLWKSSFWLVLVSVTSMPRFSAMPWALTPLTLPTSGSRTPLSALAVTSSTSSSAMSPA